MRLLTGQGRFLCNALRWAAVLFLLFCQVAAAPSASEPGSATLQTDGGIKVTLNQAVQGQGQKVNFSFAAISSGTIEKLTLIYGFAEHGCDAEGQRQALQITPGRQVQAYWAWNQNHTGPMISGMKIWWQFEIQDQAGQKTLTDTQTLLLLDTNLRWNTLQDGSISLFWYQGSQDFGQRLMDIAVHSLKNLADEAGVKSTGDIRIVIYPSADAMHAALPYVDDWAGGLAFGEYDLIVVGISPADEMGWAEDVLPHELTHMITENGFVNCEAVRLPRWLVEGIAEYTEGPISQADQAKVNDWLAADALPELKSMRYNFPSDGDTARLAYAQSAMVVSYLIDQHGPEKMNQLVEHIRTGQTIDQALRTLYGLTTDELDRTWRAEMGYGSAPEPNFITETPEPSRTPAATLDLKVPTWSAVSPVTATPTPTVVINHTATATAPATRTPIPAAVKASSTAPAASTAGRPPGSTPWLFLGGGMLLMIGFVVGVGIWMIKK